MTGCFVGIAFGGTSLRAASSVPVSGGMMRGKLLGFVKNRKIFSMAIGIHCSN
jgi:hypothetical protein